MVARSRRLQRPGLRELAPSAGRLPSARPHHGRIRGRPSDLSSLRGPDEDPHLHHRAQRDPSNPRTSPPQGFTTQSSPTIHPAPIAALLQLALVVCPKPENAPSRSHPSGVGTSFSTQKTLDPIPKDYPWVPFRPKLAPPPNTTAYPLNVRVPPEGGTEGLNHRHHAGAGGGLGFLR